MAAFFAFRDRPIDYFGDESVRIYLFDSREWQSLYRQVENLDPAFPHLSVSDFIAIDNPRLVPQQAATTAANLYLITHVDQLSNQPWAILESYGTSRS